MGTACAEFCNVQKFSFFFHVAVARQDSAQTVGAARHQPSPNQNLRKRFWRAVPPRQIPPPASRLFVVAGNDDTHILLSDSRAAQIVDCAFAEWAPPFVKDQNWRLRVVVRQLHLCLSLHCCSVQHHLFVFLYPPLGFFPNPSNAARAQRRSAKQTAQTPKTKTRWMTQSESSRRPHGPQRFPPTPVAVAIGWRSWTHTHKAAAT